MRFVSMSGRDSGGVKQDTVTFVAGGIDLVRICYMNQKCRVLHAMLWPSDGSHLSVTVFVAHTPA